MFINLILQHCTNQIICTDYMGQSRERRYRRCIPHDPSARLRTIQMKNARTFDTKFTDSSSSTWRLCVCFSTMTTYMVTLAGEISTLASTPFFSQRCSRLLKRLFIISFWPATLTSIVMNQSILIDLGYLLSAEGPD